MRTECRNVIIELKREDRGTILFKMCLKFISGCFQIAFYCHTLRTSLYEGGGDGLNGLVRTLAAV